MGMTDPIADMLTRIRNAARARHPSVEVPSSRIKERIAELLVEEGYLEAVKKVKAKEGIGEILHIQLKYDKRSQPVISGIRRVSRSGRRVYAGLREIRPVRGGLGVHILSTPKGIMVDREARKAGVGGEVILSVW